VFLAGLLRRKGVDPAVSSSAGVFLYSNLERVLKERTVLAQRAERARESAEKNLLDRSSLFSDRGVSLDTSILPDFALDQTLRDLKARGVLHDGQVLRAAVIGPGLDFIDKREESGYDYYPQQTVQPFALYDSLLRLGLAKTPGLTLGIFDISARVIDHLQRARKRGSYVIQLPRDLDRPWPPDLVSYWRSLGDHVGAPIAPIQPPEIFKGLETRAVRIRPEVVLACEPLDLNIVLERLTLPAAQRYDLVVATNIFVYYDAFQQALALANIGAMLKPGGLLLTNDKLPEVPGGSMHQAGTTVVDSGNGGVLDAVGWYRRN
jgi:SAM-dependent methyltransferase